MFAVAVLVGSLRRASFNRQLADLAITVAPPSLQLHLQDLTDLPLYNQDLDQQPPAAVLEFKRGIARADAVLVVTPEYNRSLPAVLKNAIDWGSRPNTKNNVWVGKPMGIMGASIGQFGTIHAQFDLRKVLTHTNSLVMTQPQVLVNNVESKLDAGHFDAATQAKVAQYLEAFTAWIANWQATKSPTPPTS
jgi:chromate reductase